MTTRDRAAIGGRLLTVVAGLFLLGAGCEGGSDPGTGALDDYFAQHPMVSDPRTERTEIDPNSTVVAIEPTSATVTYVGQKVQFRVYNGEGPYHWDVSISANGSIDTTDDSTSQATYTTVQVGENDIIAYDNLGHAAIATVNSSEVGMTISASPSNDLETDGDKATLTVVGGVAPYIWSVVDGTAGNFVTDADGPSQVVYERYQAGDNAAQVTDSLGSVASIVLNQEP